MDIVLRIPNATNNNHNFTWKKVLHVLNLISLNPKKMLLYGIAHIFLMYNSSVDYLNRFDVK